MFDIFMVLVAGWISGIITMLLIRQKELMKEEEEREKMEEFIDYLKKNFYIKPH